MKTTEEIRNEISEIDKRIKYINYCYDQGIINQDEHKEKIIRYQTAIKTLVWVIE